MSNIFVVKFYNDAKDAWHFYVRDSDKPSLYSITSTPALGGAKKFEWYDEAERTKDRVRQELHVPAKVLSFKDDKDWFKALLDGR